jgi:ribosomal protein S18 acetylase RimI-like enzyme
VAVTIRPLALPADGDAVRAIDASFETDHAYAVVPFEGGFRVAVEPAGRVIAKQFPVGDLVETRDWDAAFVAVESDAIHGVVACSLERWNRRLTIRHLYVHAPVRGRGIARRLLEHALEDGARRGATTAWLETPATNYPGIQAYLALGFELCGLDTTLYANTPGEGEIALFLSRAIERL